MPSKTRAVASDTTIALGLVRTIVDIVPARRSDGEVSFKLVCPLCPTETRGRQTYICEHDEAHQFTTSEADRAIEVDGTLRRVNQDEISAIKETSLPSGEITLSVFPAADVDAVSLPSGALYRLRPQAANDQAYGLLATFVGNPDYAFIGEMTMRGTQRMYRCSIWNGQIILQEMVRPSEFHAVDPITVETDPRLVEMGKQLIANLVDAFDPDAFANQVRDRAQALADAKRSGAPSPVKPKPVTPTPNSTDQLLAMLTASVAASKKPAKKPTRKAS